MCDTLNDKQERFCHEYPIDCNATQAAIRAGYAPKYANRIAVGLMAKPKIKVRITEIQAELARRNTVTLDEIVSSFREIRDRCMQRVPVMVGKGKDRTQAMDLETGQGVWTFDSNGANRANENLARTIGAFKDKVEHTGKDGGPIETLNLNLTPEERKARIDELIRKRGA